MANYFITGSGTDVGKTHILTAICQYIKKKGESVMALKPLVSGWTDEDNDVVRILHSLLLPATKANIELISLKRLKLALAPNMAANKEGIDLRFHDIIDFCNQYINKYNYLFIEGVGGVMSPLTNDATCKDLIEALNISVFFVAGVYLGSISHVLTGLESLRKCKVEAIILNEYSNEDDIDVKDLKECMQNFTNIPVLQYDEKKTGLGIF